MPRTVVQCCCPEVQPGAYVDLHFMPMIVFTAFGNKASSAMRTLMRRLHGGVYAIRTLFFATFSVPSSSLMALCQLPAIRLIAPSSRDNRASFSLGWVRNEAHILHSLATCRSVQRTCMSRAVFQRQLRLSHDLYHQVRSLIVR
jgi:hypothetical protein